MSVFAQAKAAPAAEPKTKKGKAREVQMTAELDAYTAADTTIKVLEAFKATTGEEIHLEMTNEFLTEGLATKRCPENFKGVGTHSTASCQFKARASNRALSDAEADLLTAHKVPFTTETVQAGVYFFNPEVLADQAKMAKLDKALTKLDLGLDGAPLIMRQEETTKRIVTEESMTAVFNIDTTGKSGDEVKEIVKTLMKVVATQAIKPTMNANVSFEQVAKILADAGVSLAPPAEKAAKKPAKVKA